MPKLNRLFKKIQKFDVIENGKFIHLFKVTHLDDSSAIYDNDGNLFMKSKSKIMYSTVLKEIHKREKLNKTNNNKGETMPNVKQGFEYKNYFIKQADNLEKKINVYKLINGNQRFVKSFSSTEKAKIFINGTNYSKLRQEEI
tara:strand:+ start:23 stop:448 length:426 start_codon:yes stop_codon:yes gene_type:complete